MVKVSAGTRSLSCMDDALVAEYLKGIAGCYYKAQTIAYLPLKRQSPREVQHSVSRACTAVESWQLTRTALCNI